MGIKRSMMNTMADSAVSLRRTVLLALAVGLSVAAIVAVAGILTRSFDRTDLRLVGTSLGFSIFSALGAAGTKAERRGIAPTGLGRVTTMAAVLSFALLLVALWINQGAAVWRAFGTVGVATLAGSHACLVLSNRRDTDSSLINGLAATSIATGSIDSLLGALAITGAIARVDSGYVRLLAVLVIVMLLTTALPPILRRLPSKTGHAAAGLPGTPPAAGPHDQHAVDLLAIAARLDRLVPHAGEAAKQIQAETAHLRRMAGGS
jgi:hypothetical protein